MYLLVHGSKTVVNEVVGNGIKEVLTDTIEQSHAKDSDLALVFNQGPIKGIYPEPDSSENKTALIEIKDFFKKWYLHTDIDSDSFKESSRKMSDNIKNALKVVLPSISFELKLI